MSEQIPGVLEKAGLAITVVIRDCPQLDDGVGGLRSLALAEGNGKGRDLSASEGRGS